MNIFALNKKEKSDRLKFRCVHRHNGIDHPKCYENEREMEEKIGFLDIETSNLNADFGYILSYCIKELNGNLIERVLTTKEIRNQIYDKNLMKQFCEDARKFDRLMTYYGSRFDIPFLRTRCIYWGLDFPLYKEIKHTDVYILVKHKLNLHSKRLGIVASFFKIPAKAHPLNPEVWFRCMSGEKKALDYVLIHNKEDVISLEEVWKKLENYTKLTNTSL